VTPLALITAGRLDVYHGRHEFSRRPKHVSTFLLPVDVTPQDIEDARLAPPVTDTPTPTPTDPQESQA
jgi:hypothetical protein